MVGPITSPLVGLWLTLGGDVVEKPCPTAWEASVSVQQRAKMPQGCRSFASGVLLSSETYLTLEVKLARLEAENKALLERERILAEERQLLIADLQKMKAASAQEGVAPAGLLWLGLGFVGGYGVCRL